MDKMKQDMRNKLNKEMIYDMDNNRKEEMRFYNVLTGKKYFPNWEKSFSQLGTYFKGTYVHQLTNICSSAHEHMFMASRTYVLRIFLFVMMMVTGVNVWGQNTPKVADGVYYIKTADAYKGPNATITGISASDYDKNTSYYWYIWPSVTTSDPLKQNALDNGNGTEYYRYLTTLHRTDAPAFNNGAGQPSWPAMDNTYCHWVVKFIGFNGSVETYQIINPKLNKYVIWTSTSGVKHTQLEGTANRQGDLDHSYFDIESVTDGYYIHTRNIGNNSYNTSVFNVKSDDKPHLSTSGGSHEPVFNPGTNGAGLIQGTTTEKYYKKYVFDPNLLAAPTISDVSATNAITITDANSLPAGYTIRYTTGNGTQDAPTATTGNVYSDPIDVTSSMTVKAVVVRYGIVLTEVASKAVVPVIAAPMVTNNYDGTISLSTATTGATIYYTTNGDTPDNNSTPYSSAFSLGDATVIKAIAYLGSESSGVTTYNVPQYTTPTISFNSSTSQVTITSSGTVYYTTDGGTPTTSSTSYSTPFSISSAATIKAIATHAGYITSEVATLAITQVATPTIQNNGSNAISITSATDGATIYYTTDGSTPTTSSTEYTGPLTENVSGVTIKAIAVKENMITSAVGSGSVTLKCATPVVTRDGMKFTLSCSMPTDATIYYSLDGSTPTISYSGAVSFTPEQLPLTVTAVAKHAGYSDSDPVTKTLKNGDGTASDPWLIYGATDFANFISDVNAGTTSSDCYKLETDISASGADAITTAFTGTFDGGLHTISDLDHALFNTIDGGTVKNVILDNVNITTGTNVGAIANEVTGTSDNIAAIYNCGILSGSVSGSGYVGGLVGQLGSSTADNCYARVINCFSYATVSGGTHVGGIVGYNMYASKSDNIRTMVMNCMMYGNITGGGDIAPVYNGQKITNVGSSKGLNNYNYFSYQDLTATINTYNCALGVEKRIYLQRFEFYRNILNSNRELACWYATGSTTNARQTMAKWVLEKADRNNSNPYPYPILKAQGYYPSIVNIDAEHATSLILENDKPQEADRNKGGKLGTLTVYIQDGSGGAVFSAPSGASVHTGTLTLNITDKDEDRYNYNYRKVQLPYYNDVGDGNYTGNRVVTGWKITSVVGNTTNKFKDNTTYPEGATDQDILGIDDCYNFADRTDTGKDLYGTSGRVFAQGAYYDVPDNVTAITIQPYWAKCTYLSDANYDVTYNTNNNNATNVTAMGSRPNTVNGGQTVYTSMADALSNSNLGRNASHTVYDYAVVLVGNYHHYSGSNSYVGNNYNNNNTNPDLPVTLMSADLDGDNEPDNVFFLQHGKTRIGLCPIRYDFLCVPDIGLAQKADGLTRMPSIGTFWPYGWFETTNTSLMHIGQMEYATTKRVVAPLILQGGVFEQTFVSWQGGESTSKNRTNYIHLGGNAYFEEFSNGSHLNNTQFTPHVPVSVTGGECKSFYLSGMMLPKNNGTPTEKADNAEGYIDGGKFGEVASGGMQKIDGNVTWIIYNADIDNFYGGGINANKPVTGSISTTMRDCHVTTYCGGPKFGNMTSNTTVTSDISGGQFGTFFGAGYGGTSLTKQSTQQDDKFSDTSKWGTWANSYDRQYNASNGIASRYEFSFFQFSGGSDNTQVGQMYVYYASMSLAETKNVTTTMNGSIVTGNFYGGGSLGKVTGNVNSTLTNCTIKGNVFGAGFSATIPTVDVMNTGVTNPEPGYDVNAGVFTEAGYPSSVTYTWKQAQSVSAGNEFDETEGNYILTTENLSKSNLGSVAGNITLTLTTSGDGKTTIGTANDDTTGNVYGGGEESYVTGAANKVTVTLQGNTEVLGNVFGGGDEGLVEGSTEVNIE